MRYPRNPGNFVNLSGNAREIKLKMFDSKIELKKKYLECWD